MIPDIVSIKIDRNDIFDYVIGNTNYDPIERCIDPTVYEVFDTAIYNHNTKQTFPQDEVYVNFSTQVSKLRSNAKNMETQEILRICEELEEVSPRNIYL